MSPTVVLAVRGSREAEIAAALDAAPDVSLVRRCADLVEAVAVVEAGLAEVMVASVTPLVDRALVRRLAKAHSTIVALSDEESEVERALACGAAAAMASDVQADILLSTVVEAAHRVRAPQARRGQNPGGSAAVEGATVPDRRGYLVAVWGPTGAPGRTTLAVNIAAEIAEAGTEAMVVDLDTYGGAVSSSLGLLDESPGVAALARAGLQGTLAPEMLDRHSLPVGERLRVLTGISRPQRWPEMPAAALDPMWGLLRALPGATVVDCGFCIEGAEAASRGGSRNEAALSALSAADVVVVVGGAEPVAVQRLVQALDELAALGSAESSARVVVVNRVRASVAGPRPREAVADALARFAGVEEVWAVPYDPRALDAAVLAGQTLLERAPRSPARRAIAAVAEFVHECGSARVGSSVEESAASSVTTDPAWA